MFSTEEFIIAVFCCVDDALQPLLAAHPIEFARGFAPQLSPAEVLTMELVGEYRGIDTDKGIWQYFCGHWHSLFPHLSSRTSFTRQAANLWQYKHLTGVITGFTISAANGSEREALWET